MHLNGLTRVVCGIGLLASLSFGQAMAADVTGLFLSRAAAPCPAAERGPPTYRQCQNATCPTVVTGERMIPAQTGWDSGQCGFRAAGWALAWCRANVDGSTVRATSPWRDTRRVDFFKEQCKNGVECFVPTTAQPECRAEGCGVEVEGAVISYQACRHHQHGVDLEALVVRWNAATASGDTGDLAVLRVVLLLHEMRGALAANATVTDQVVAFLSSADPSQPGLKERLDRLADAIETGAATLTADRVREIAG